MKLQHVPLPPDELRRLHASYARRKLRRTRDKLLQAYVPLALGLAHRYALHPNHVEDLQSSALRGLMEALNRYQAKLGQFETYAYFWIVKYILMAREFDRSLVRIPTSVVREHRRLRRRIQLGDTVEAIAKDVGRSPSEVEQMLELFERPVCVSWDELSFNGGPPPYGPPTSEEHDPDREAQGEAAVALISQLDPLQRQVMEYRHTHPKAPVPHREIGRRLGIGAETVRQTYNKALARLRTLMKHARQMD
jgi:RNA polymerase sigma-B factor